MNEGLLMVKNGNDYNNQILKELILRKGIENLLGFKSSLFRSRSNRAYRRFITWWGRNDIKQKVQMTIVCKDSLMINSQDS